MQNQNEQNSQQNQKVQKIKKDKNKRLYKFKVPKTKFELIRAILVRWWYGLSQWPCQQDYQDKLKQQNLIEVQENEIQRFQDDTEHTYVYKLDNYPGVYANSQGKLFDLRDNKNKPCFNNLRKKENKDLALILKKCLENQIKELQGSVYYENNLNYALRKFLRRFLRVYNPILESN